MKTISIFNQKGGVGKTTTVVNLSCGLGLKGKKVLVIDLDPQGNTSSGLGINKNELSSTVYDLFVGESKSTRDLILETSSKNVDIIPSNIDLSGVEIELINLDEREFFVRKALESVKADYDFIIIDCPPSLGLLSINALVASDSVIIPIQSEYYALEGLSLIIETINLVKKSLNKSLEIEGVLITMYDGRNNLSSEVEREVKRYFKDKVFNSVIPRNVRLAEAPSFGESIFTYDKNSLGAAAFKDLTKEIINNNR
ncbi:AAA family ATPase [Lagierella sp.]|uniref:ParA family protein n=1 Tax=Lagierella sp. TaxID=2849657 RepID=UPI0026089A52|nr:AAA family ATPase [Lagierella sp.]